MEDVDLIPWPAMLVTPIASWLVASEDARKRNGGLGAFLLAAADAGRRGMSAARPPEGAQHRSAQHEGTPVSDLPLPGPTL